LKPPFDIVIGYTANLVALKLYENYQNVMNSSTE
jgi:hypothetical protein